jgi:alkylation response protein AidB-like acyl-CoA dehydrogenase
MCSILEHVLPSFGEVPRVDFTLDPTAREVAELAATVLRDADHGRVEKALAGESGYDETAWKAMAQAGLLSLAIPTDQGGDGLGAVEVTTVLTAVGRQTLPLPALATLALGVLPLVRLGGASHLSGDADVLTAALSPMTLTNGRVDGRARGVPYAEQARLILVATDGGVALVDPSGDGVTLTRTTTSTRAPEYTVACTSVTPVDVLPGGVADIEIFALAGAAAVADGVIAGALALTAEHLRTREQFGRPLATFQAVAQQVADVYVTARTMHLASATVNWQLAQGRPSDADLQIAGYWLAAELPTALQVCHHLHGGLGVDITYPLHRYYSQAKDLARLVGGAAHRLDRIAACTSN